MISEVYSIYDEASESFVLQLFGINAKTMRMQLEQMFKQKRLNVPMLQEYPNNFAVYCIGTFDDNKGLFENKQQHELLVRFSEFTEDNTNT